MSVYLALTPDAFDRLPPGAAANARIVLDAALSGGSLQEVLETAVKRYGAKRLALRISRVAMDFPLPCPSGEGRSLSREELSALCKRGGARVCFSQALCAKYFTYRGESGTRFVLFDDAETIRRKRTLARSLGIEDVILPFPAPGESLDELLRL